ncbi:calcium-dependent protein kinase 29-like [Papaver somniferum]|uniref:calcium-dependent protein kinase 29-like n=1 Tax=Papaver somniferum TaxID=3469 RepID=UPI000E701FD7|nr:calcium-dependent protein kinase 29-like [Papaver somniferum]
MNASVGGGLKSRYETEKELAKCGRDTGAVYPCKDKVTNEYVACKSINRMSYTYNPDFIKREIMIMNELTHPNVVSLKSVYVDDDHVDLIMENCSGSDLHNRLTEITRFTESNAKFFFKQLMGVVESCHERALEMPDQDPVYDQAVDVWSPGVVLFCLLSGSPPFYGETNADIIENIKDGGFYYDRCLWINISELAKDLVSGMLCKDPAKRLTATEWEYGSLYYVFVTDIKITVLDRTLRTV